MTDKTPDSDESKKIPTFAVHIGDIEEQPVQQVVSGEEDSPEIVEETPATERPEDVEKTRTMGEREDAIEFLEKTSASQLEKVEGTFEEVDGLLEEYDKLKGMVKGITKNHPELRKYL